MIEITRLRALALQERRGLSMIWLINCVSVAEHFNCSLCSVIKRTRLYDWTGMRYCVYLRSSNSSNELLGFGSARVAIEMFK